MMSVFDYAVLPPEINSGRMYAGAGSGPLLAAVAAWDGLASELSLAASSYQSTVLELTGGVWLGPASAAMAAVPRIREGAPDWVMTPTAGAADAGDALSDRERYELHELRKEIADLAMQRDAVDRLIKEAMRR